MSDWFDAEAHADRAFELYERGRWAEAEAELRKAISLNPDQPEWYFNLGLTLEAAGRDREALSAYERAIDLLPDQPDPLVVAGTVANRLNRFEDAVRWFDEALRLDPKHESAYSHKIESHLRLGDHEEAEATYYLAQQALDEPSAPCLAIMAESLIQRREFERAAWCLKEAMRHDPSAPRLRARLGSVYAALGKPQRALQLYLRDLRDDPGNIDTLLDYGELLITFGRLPEAGEKFRRVLEIEPANVDAHVRLGQVAMHAGRYEQAHLEFELVLKLDPDYPQIRLDLAESLLRRNRRIDAQQQLLEELELIHHDDAERETEDAPRAAMFDGLTSITEANPDLPRLGRLLLEVGLPAQAARVYERALNDSDWTRNAQRRPELLRKLALARFRAGERAGGVIASRQVLRFEPDCIDSIHNLSLAAIEEERLEVAAGWIARGMRINRHDDGLRRLRTRLWMAMIGRAIRRALPLRRTDKPTTNNQ